MPAPTLKQLATATAIKHVKMLDDIGSLPYALARPMLLKVDNPEKLHSMELLSPHLAEEDQEIWLEFIKRDIPQWDTYDIPRHTNQWYDIYCDLREEVQRSLDADAEKLKMAIDGIQSQKARLTPKIIAGPRGKHRPSMRQIYASKDRKMGGIPPPFNKSSNTSSASASVSDSSSSFTFGGSSRVSGFGSAGSKPPKKSIFAPQRRNNALAIPTKHLSTRASRVKQAPRSLIEEHRRPMDPPASASASASSSASRHDRNAGVLTQSNGRIRQGSKPVPSNPAFGPKSAALAEREARLQAIASGKPLPSHGNADSKKPASSGDSPSTPAKRPILKRRAVSPPSPVAATSQASPPPPPAPRPAVIRKRPDNVFIQPKRKRVG
ncbi:RNA polymerase II transcription factor SIII subunit A [Penicillium waksmanii]|uniref:RNA polymerase II transcription factor SIII subunit A n=1 Tax=Penicillium waksmanii TaxID=69791 RepID=UPI002548FBF5|nr:RNA polymerase II transcription factor SIII subunit A [Penicillium waksmanii]KAJ5988522.1 RNA polymerase II transcription factor SIII subunit A [Penicillium waksmanii]